MASVLVYTNGGHDRVVKRDNLVFVAHAPTGPPGASGASGRDFSTVAAAELEEYTEPEHCYVKETSLVYQYDSTSTATRDGKFVLNTGGAGRLIAIGGVVYDPVARKIFFNAATEHFRGKVIIDATLLGADGDYLTLEGDGGSNNRFLIRRSGQDILTLGAHSSQANVIASSGKKLIFHTDGYGTSDAVLDTDGNLGLDQPSPTARLDAKCSTSDSSAHTIKLENSNGDLGLSLRGDNQLYHSGSFVSDFDEVTTDTTLTNSAKRVIVLNPSASGVVVTLPANPEGQEYKIINISIFLVTIARNGKEINGAAANIFVEGGSSRYIKYFDATAMWRDLRTVMKDLTLYANDPQLSMAAGENPLLARVSHYNVCGENPNISATGSAHIWDGSGLWVPPTAPRQHNVASDNAADTGTLRSSGTVDSSTATTLVDSSASFVTDGVVAGDVVINDDNFDHTTITGVTETTLTFIDGTIHANDPKVDTSGFDVGDNYRVVGATSTGVSVVHLYGLNSNRELIEEFVIMNGTSSVSTSLEFGTIYEAHSDGAADRDNTNIGTITITAQTDNTITAQINPGNGTTGMAFFPVPKGKTAYITGIHADIVKSGAVSSSANLSLRVTPLARIDGAGSRDERYFGVNDSGSSSYSHMFKPYESYPENTDLWVLCNECSSNGTVISAGFDIILVDNA